MARTVAKPQRLILRPWRPEDRAPFASLNADPAVMEHFPSTLSRAESDAVVDRIEAHFDRHGFGLWAVEISGVTAFAGFIGLSVPAFKAHFTPCAEIGWRLAREYWGKGYATTGAVAALRFGFEGLGLAEVVSFTVPANLRSRRVMERIGMSHSPADDFDHPLLPAEHPFRRHVLYRMSKAHWADSYTQAATDAGEATKTPSTIGTARSPLPFHPRKRAK